MLISVLGSRATGENAASTPANDAQQASQAAEDMTVDIEREPVVIKAGDRIEVQRYAESTQPTSPTLQAARTIVSQNPRCLA